jgi:SAM-dependent methyltransferase
MSNLPSKLSPGVEKHLESLRGFYSHRQRPKPLSPEYARRLAHRYNLLINDIDAVLEIGCGEGSLLHLLRGRVKCGVDLSAEQIERGKILHPELDLRVGAGEQLSLDGGHFDIIIVSDVLNQAGDVEVLLRRLHTVSHADTRLLINIHNTLWRPLIGLGQLLGLARRPPPSNWLSRSDVMNLCRLADWEVFKTFGQILLPLPVPLLAAFVNRWIAPAVEFACLTTFLVARPVSRTRREAGVVSVVVPARNEAGSLAQLLTRVPRLGAETELIIIEGHSKDSTWEVIQGLPDVFPGGRIRKMRQTGKGKGNAVREAFAAASGDIVTILDADLTMPPEDLPKYVEALSSGKADFANGVRLVYPMDQQAMRFANLCANKAFSLVFSWLLGQPVKDTLCGTKAMWKKDYARLDANRAYFGDFDPFGDFDLLFGADKLNLKIMDVPIRYRERFYGETNIQRWRHGVILLGMVMFAARRLKFV